MNEPLAFDIDTALARVTEAVRPFPKAAMFELRERGFGTVFQQLVACMISIRTRDEVSLPVSERLFRVAPTPADVLRLGAERLIELLEGTSFREGKATQILEIARRTESEFEGMLPADAARLREFHGVGPKCANLAVGVATGEAEPSVDIHVHRITNRWGYVTTTTPEGTLEALKAKLPRRYWVEINALLVPFGKHVCTGVLPQCDSCPVRDMCPRIGVSRHR